MDGPHGKSFPSSSSAPSPVVRFSGKINAKTMPSTHAMSRHRMFRCQPRNRPVRNSSLISPPPMASFWRTFSYKSTMSSKPPPTAKPPSSASIRFSSTFPCKNRKTTRTTIPVTMKRSGIIYPSKSVNAAASSRHASKMYSRAWSEISYFSTSSKNVSAVNTSAKTCPAESFAPQYLQRTLCMM